jgi:hypothetical protein
MARRAVLYGLAFTTGRTASQRGNLPRTDRPGIAPPTVTPCGIAVPPAGG